MTPRGAGVLVGTVPKRAPRPAMWCSSEIPAAPSKRRPTVPAAGAMPTKGEEPLLAEGEELFASSADAHR